MPSKKRKSSPPVHVPSGDVSPPATIFKVSKTQFSHLCAKYLWPQKQWAENIKQHLDTSGLKPKPTTIMVAEEGRRFGQPHTLLPYSNDYIRGWSGCSEITDDVRATFPLFGNVICVFSDNAFTKAGYGDPKTKQGLEHIKFY